MAWQTTQLNSPFIKGIGHTALGVGICGLVYFVDRATTMFVQEEEGKIIKYLLYTGGVITALGGISKIVNGQ